MSDLVFLEVPWGKGKIRRLVRGGDWEDNGDGSISWVEHNGSWFELRCMAYDKGKPELLIDCIQLEDAISRIPEPRVRAAMILACFGHLFADHDIGALLGGRGKHETGTALIERGIKWVARHEHNRAEDRQK